MRHSGVCLRCECEGICDMGCGRVIMQLNLGVNLICGELLAKYCMYDGNLKLLQPRNNIACYAWRAERLQNQGRVNNLQAVGMLWASCSHVVNRLGNRC